MTTGTEIRGIIVAGGVGVQASVVIRIYDQRGEVAYKADQTSLESGHFSYTHRLIVDQPLEVEATKDGYHKAIRKRAIAEKDLNSGWIEFGKIELIPTHRTIKGKVTSHGRPLESAKICPTLDGTRLPITYSFHDGTFELVTEKEGGTLSGIVRKLGYKTREIGPRIVARSAIEIDLDPIELEPWWHNLHPWVDRIMDTIRQHRVMVGLVGVILVFAVIYYLFIGCPKNVKSTDFTKEDKHGKSVSADHDFNECGEGQTQCDKKVVQCMKERGYRYSRQ